MLHMRRSVFSEPSDTNLERAKQHLIEHYADAMASASMGTNVPAQTGSLMDFVFPIVRRAPNTFPYALDFLKIQPMTQPRGSIFYMDYVYGGERYEFVRGWHTVVPGALVLGTRQPALDEAAQHTIYVVVSVQKAKVTMTGEGRIVTTSITNIVDPDAPVKKQEELRAA